MSNPFKPGDKVVALNPHAGEFHVGKVYEVLRVNNNHVVIVGKYENGYTPLQGEHYSSFRAAIAGQDYPLEPSGHHPDGGGVQSHSAGGLYPVVICWRDAKASDRKYDAGVILPGHDPIWFKSYDAAVEFGEAWLKGKS